MENSINYCLSKSFKRSQCYQFLEYIIEQNPDMHNSIVWIDENYYQKINGNYVKYNYYPDTGDISVRVGNNERKIDITILKYGNRVHIRDRKIDRINRKEKIDIHHIIHNTNRTSYYNHKNVIKHNNGNLETKYDRRLHIDDYTKKVIDHYDSDDKVDNKKEYSNMNTIKQKVLIKKPNKVRVWHHY